jgi:hypothetical protein
VKPNIDRYSTTPSATPVRNSNAWTLDDDARIARQTPTMARLATSVSFNWTGRGMAATGTGMSATGISSAQRRTKRWKEPRLANIDGAWKHGVLDAM